MRTEYRFADDRDVVAAHRAGNRVQAFSFGVMVECRGCPGFLDRRDWTDTTQRRTDYPVRFKRLGWSTTTFITRH